MGTGTKRAKRVARNNPERYSALMINNPLNIVSVASNAQKPPVKEKPSRRQEIQAKMERLWHQDPQQFDPERDCLQRQRIQQTREVIMAAIPLQGHRVVDLGCGTGSMSAFFANEGVAHVDAVDVASQSLALVRALQKPTIKAIQDCLPMTKLEDDSYDLVVCTEVIGYLHPQEYRAFFSELARLVNAKGLVACSSSFDLNSEDPLERFAVLAETELEIERWVLNYHRLFINICHLFERIYKPLGHRLKQSVFLRDALEPICKFLWSERGISHALFLGRRRPLNFVLPENEIPREMKHKRQVWE